MTDAERIAKAGYAEAAYKEFFEPMLDELDAEYAARILDVATTELFFWRRTSKITRLSDALRMVRTLRSGMLEYIRDGDLAHREKLRAEKIENMTAPARRLLQIGSY